MLWHCLSLLGEHDSITLSGIVLEGYLLEKVWRWYWCQLKEKKMDNVTDMTYGTESRKWTFFLFERKEIDWSSFDFWEQQDELNTINKKQLCFGSRREDSSWKLLFVKFLSFFCCGGCGEVELFFLILQNWKDRWTEGRMKHGQDPEDSTDKHCCFTLMESLPHLLHRHCRLHYHYH